MRSVTPQKPSIDQIGEERRRELFRQNAKANTMRMPMPTDTDDVAYTEADRAEHAAWLESVKGAAQ